MREGKRKAAQEVIVVSSEEEDGHAHTAKSGRKAGQKGTNKRLKASVAGFVVPDGDSHSRSDDEYVDGSASGSSSSRSYSESGSASEGDADEDEGVPTDHFKRLSKLSSAKIQRCDLPYSSSGRITTMPSLEQAIEIEKLALKKEYAPIAAIDEMFADLVKRAPLVKQLAGEMAGRQIRVATMCSGTEAPLLALKLISRAMKAQHGSGLQVEHAFSCEIEPFKQSYIQRNFAPPLLFRDICELGEDQAHTAFGGLADVPGDVDILVAGTSCVDFSVLNKQRKGIDEAGESGRTFFGMLRWLKKHKPAVVILENVKLAPWDTIAKHVEGEGYEVACYRSFDTRNFYIPHTRQRGYLFATRTSSHDSVEQWLALVRSLTRPASSPFDDFLLKPDDAHLHVFRKSFKSAAWRHRRFDWSKCKARHERVRQSQKLGIARPYTAWVEEGSRSLPNGGWNEWAARQPDRIADLLDIVYLQQAKRGVDMAFKSKAVQIQQNVDRSVSSSKLGVCGCLTPKGEMFLTLYGRPMCGVEALALQGIPVEELDLTRESNDQLIDLAGNAMSSTVVGAALLTALIVLRKSIGRRRQTLPPSRDNSRTREWLVPTEVEAMSLCAGQDFTAEADTSAYVNTDLAGLLTQAHRTAQRCACHGDAVPLANEIRICGACGQGACETCRGRPAHVAGSAVSSYQEYGPFLKALHTLLPMALRLSALDRKDLRTQARGGLQSAQAWTSRISEVLCDRDDGIIVLFDRIERGQTWRMHYRGENVRVVLNLHERRPRWELFVEPPAAMSCHNELRAVLRLPVLSMNVPTDTGGILAGTWKLRDPFSPPVTYRLTPFGERCPTWRAQMGLSKGKGKRFTRLKVNTDDSDRRQSTCDIRGTYELLPHCGTAMTSLYRRIEGKTEDESMFVFLQSDRHSRGEQDRMVFSKSVGSEVDVVASLPKGWRIPNASTKVLLTDETRLHRLNKFRAEPVQIRSSKWLLEDGHIAQTTCDSVTTLLAVSTSAIEGILSAIAVDTSNPEGDWKYVDARQAISRKLRGMASVLHGTQIPAPLLCWNGLDDESSLCPACVPCPPRLLWYQKSMSVNGIAKEDEREAGYYEQALKRRTPSLTLRWRRVSNKLEFQLGISPRAMAHRAAGRLPRSRCVESSAIQLSWRMRADKPGSEVGVTETAFELHSNQGDSKAPHPLPFLLRLRPEQRRSLQWMQDRERPDTEMFEEEEVEESVLGYPAWRVQARASRSVRVRGGILADAVGYGKTCITLALIASSKGLLSAAAVDAALSKSHVRTEATLIIVPPQLCKQWESEAEKFCGSGLEVLVIATISAMQSTTVEEIVRADVVIVGASVLRKDAYYDNLSRFSGANLLPAKSGRMFDATHEHTLRGLRNRVREMKAGRMDAMAAAINARSDFYPGLYNSVDGNSAAESGHGPVRRVAGEGASKVNDDVWGVCTKAVRSDWRRLCSPPLEIFLWKRVVVDEYPYHLDYAVDRRALTTIRQLSAASRWMLSGTPPMKDFADVRSIALLVGVHLGVEDDNDIGRSDGRHRFERQRTDSERFHSYNEVHCPAWHRRRARVAQSFLDHFVRRNEAEIEPLTCIDQVVPLTLSFFERALYLEIDNRLQLIDEQRYPGPGFLKEGEGSGKATEVEGTNDRRSRWRNAVEGCASAEEVLTVQANMPHSVVDADVEICEDAYRACKRLLNRRRKEGKECLRQFEEQLEATIDQHFVVLLQRHFRDETAQALVIFASNTIDGEWGDADCKPAIVEVMKGLDCVPDELDAPAGQRRYGEVDRYRKDVEQDWLEESRLRNMVDLCTRLRDEYWSRRKGLRYLQTIASLHKASASGNYPRCSALLCKTANTDLSADQIVVSDACGHLNCVRCSEEGLAKGKCAVLECCATLKPCNVIGLRQLNLGRNRFDVEGVKLAKLTAKVRQIVAADGYILVFVQFSQLLDAVAESLHEHGVDMAMMQGSADRRSEILNAFQRGQHRVLLLDIADESAAGSNLTIANHIIFVNPFVATDQHRYDATMEQAKGRAVRYGQSEAVNVWRFVLRDTIEQHIVERRERSTLEEVVRRGGRSGGTKAKRAVKTADKADRSAGRTRRSSKM